VPAPDDQARPGARPWTDPGLPRAERISLLLAEMTLEEKVAQLGSAWRNSAVTGIQVAPGQDVFTPASSYEQARKDGLGHLTRPFGTRPADPLQAARELADLQQDLVDNTRLAIPAIAHEECLTGFTTYRATVFPTALAWAATYDPDLIQAMAAAIGTGMRDGGVHQGLAPVLDVVRDHRWGRVEETLGEDPYLAGIIGSAYVRGLQAAGITATLKHFAGYSASQAGRNHAPVHMGPRELREVMLVPFEMAIDAGAGSVMTSYAEIDGIPATADPGLLTRVLRDELAFAGTTVSDYWAIAFLEATHHLATTPAAAAAIALSAGVDVELPDTRCYAALAELVRAGEVPEALLDAAAARVLGHKLDLGLLDADWSAVPAAVARGHVDLDPPANRELARRIAENSIILLSNRDSALPLRHAQIALIGPCADDAHTFFGCYSYPNHVLTSHPELDDGVQAPTLREALAAELPASQISYRQGCSVSGPERDRIVGAVAAARAADVCVLVVGDRPGMFGHGTSGEGCDVPDLTLPGVQRELADAVLATGTPTVLVVISGRPYALGRYAGKAAAVMQAFLPGEEGGPALAGVISGRVNPSGKLPVQVARDSGINPASYLHPALGGYSHTISSLDPTPLFPFGHGLSYTTFRYSDLRISSPRIPTDGAVTASVTVTNTGDRAGTESVQLYFRDPVAPVTRPVRQLLGFARLPLEPGQAATACFDIHTDRFAFVGASLDRVVEPGAIELYAASSSADIRSAATLELQGPARTVCGERRLVTSVRVQPHWADP